MGNNVKLSIFSFFISRYYFPHMEMLKYRNKGCALLAGRKDVEKLCHPFLERRSYGPNCVSPDLYAEALTAPTPRPPPPV